VLAFGLIEYPDHLGRAYKAEKKAVETIEAALELRE